MIASIEPKQERKLKQIKEEYLRWEKHKLVWKRDFSFSSIFDAHYKDQEVFGIWISIRWSRFNRLSFNVDMEKIVRNSGRELKRIAQEYYLHQLAGIELSKQDLEEMFPEKRLK